MPRTIVTAYLGLGEISFEVLLEVQPLLMPTSPETVCRIVYSHRLFPSQEIWQASMPAFRISTSSHFVYNEYFA